jgi:hypothetical protein
MFESRFRSCAVFLITTLITGLLLLTNPATAQTVHLYAFKALGASWIASDVTWVEVEKQWLVDATIRVTKPLESGLTGPQILSAFCEEMLHQRPQIPDDAIERTTIFRVNLNVLGQSGEPIWPFGVPVPVSDGKCPVTDESKTYFPTYPGRLAGWQLTDGGIQKIEDDYRFQLTFAPDKAADANSQPFDPVAACEATRVDPSVHAMQSQFEKLARVQNIDVQTDIIAIFVKFPVEPGSNTGAFAGSYFDISSGACIAHK